MASIQRDGEFNLTKPGAVGRGIVALLSAFVLLGLGPALDHLKILQGSFAISILLAGLFVGGVAVVSFIRSASFKAGPIKVDEEGVRLGSVLVPKRMIKSAWFAPGAGRLRSTVQLIGDGDRRLGQVAVTDKADADEILDTLALGANQRTARFSGFAPRGSTASHAARAMFALGFLPMALVFFIGAPGLIALSVLLWIVGSAVFLPCKIHVGADGLLIATRVAPTFIPWSEVTGIESRVRGVIVRRSRGDVEIPIASPGKLPNDYDRVLQQALLARAREAFAAYRRGDEPDVAARVARRGRPHSEWIRELFDREGSFRTAPILDDQLWSVVESPIAEPTARAGAAAVLARTASDVERSRLRIAADACTEPRLRVVLDRAASGASEPEVEEALVAIEEDDSALASLGSRE